MQKLARNTRRPDVQAALIGVGALALLGGTAILARRKARLAPQRKVQLAAQTMGASIVADSAMQHLRGGFHNPAMYAAPALATLSTAGTLARTQAGRPLHVAAIATGAAGLSFHAYNIVKRPGGVSWNNLFYAAPIGAPGGLAVTGALALAQRATTRGHGRLLAGFVALATLAETAEVALLHYRGAWHNPAMFTPVTLPPVAAALLLDQALWPRPAVRRLTRGALRLMAAMGVVGTGFHIYGVSRNMGGWGNWRQTAFAGPPVPAPSSFCALALAGDAALDLIEDAP
ncbi:hypothetical protein JHW45_01055 [Paracoccus stylophorae]|uniref:Uncharacterized protein n=1 Tax=Paracoccus stylophorae TaxID=659350 RepID=A0ABY7SVT0_9RHOB|nr:hypothetical protein [Paracoccus stylophorae]WCR11036.1 hypothetical protein JHW45_01055 [Paracoccus stylophorae]